MKKGILLASLLVGSMAMPALAATDAPPVPANSQLVGTISVSQIRQFPEQRQTKNGTSAVEETQKVNGIDKLYETKTSYTDSVSFLDKALKDQHFVVNAKTTTKTSTLWDLSEQNGDPAAVAVRNTSPTTIEWITVRGQSSTSKP